jgi:hypothetical protein
VRQRLYFTAILRYFTAIPYYHFTVILRYFTVIPSAAEGSPTPTTVVW